MSEDRIDNTDLVLLLLWAPTRYAGLRSTIPGITRLEKLLYLLDREGDAASYVETPFEFEAYDFGPYSRGVYEAVEVLEAADLVREEVVHSGRDLDAMETRIIGVADEPPGTERRFFLTDVGQDVAAILAKSAPKAFLDKITAIKDQYGALSLSELIHYVYTKYPESASRSLIRGRVLGEP